MKKINMFWLYSLSAVVLYSVLVVIYNSVYITLLAGISLIFMCLAAVAILEDIKEQL